MAYLFIQRRQQFPLKDSIIGQNLELFQVKVKYCNLHFTIITERCAGEA